jgi:hypothetical protein
VNVGGRVRANQAKRTAEANDWYWDDTLACELHGL